jgi:hypothetical protein
LLLSTDSFPGPQKEVCRSFKFLEVPRTERLLVEYDKAVPF